MSSGQQGCTCGPGGPGRLPYRSWPPCRRIRPSDCVEAPGTPTSDTHGRTGRLTEAAPQGGEGPARVPPGCAFPACTSAAQESLAKL